MSQWWDFFWVHINKSGFLWWEAFDGKVEWGGVVGLCMEGGGGGITHVLRTSTCLLCVFCVIVRAPVCLSLFYI